ncbi:MAG: hypothetical protein EOM35_08955 [Negativicutes bacterium]|nr:hypothetical protein [Negativicutes bacterium]
MNSNDHIALLNPLRPSTNDYWNERQSTMQVLKGIIETGDPYEEIIRYSQGIEDFELLSAHICKINKQIYRNSLRILQFPDSTSSCICMARTSVLERIGYFASSKFCGYGGEDIDICWEVMRRGLLATITNDVYIHHFRGKSIGQKN